MKSWKIGDGDCRIVCLSAMWSSAAYQESPSNSQPSCSGRGLFASTFQRTRCEVLLYGQNIRKQVLIAGTEFRGRRQGQSLYLCSSDRKGHDRSPAPEFIGMQAKSPIQIVADLCSETWPEQGGPASFAGHSLLIK